MIPRELKKYFWDIDIDKLDIKKYSEYVISRVLEYGDAAALRWLFRNYKKSDFKKVLTKRRGLSAKTANYWGLMLGVPSGKILCLKKQYQNKLTWPY